MINHYLINIRLETVNFKKLHSAAKVVGTAVTVMGAMVMTLYKGPIIDFLKKGAHNQQQANNGSADQHWVTGTLLLLASICGWASFFILQVSNTHITLYSS